MGLKELLFGQQYKPPIVTSIMPEAAKNEIFAARLPVIDNATVFLQADEQCHYVESAVLLKEKVQKIYPNKRAGFSIPGFIKGTRIHFGGGQTNPKDKIVTEQFAGTLFVTNKRIIFVAQKNGFDKSLSVLTAINANPDSIELQFGEVTYRMVLPDGNLAAAALRLIK